MDDVLQALMSGDAALTSGLMLVLLLSIFVNLYFIQDRTRNKLSKQKRKKLMPSMVQEYLNEQAQKTEGARRHQARKHMNSSVLKLRSAYLAIESKCIDRGVDSDAYWNMLNSRLQKLFKILTEQRSVKALIEIEEKIHAIKSILANSPKSGSKKSVLKSLDKLHIACIENHDNPAKLKHFSDKLSNLLMRLSNANYRDTVADIADTNRFMQGVSPAIKGINESVTAMDKSADNIEQAVDSPPPVSLAAIRKVNKDMQTSIGDLNGNIANVQESVEQLSSKVVMASTEVEIKSAKGEIDDISDEMLEAADREIERLRDVVSTQRSTISELEESLQKIQKIAKAEAGESEEADARSKLIDDEVNLLKKNLYEAEQCVVMLEREIDELKVKREEKAAKLANTLEGVIAEDVLKPELIDSDQLDALQQTITALETEALNKDSLIERNEKLIQFIRESVEAGTTEDISLLVYQTVQDLGFNSNLLVYGDTRTLELNRTGKLAQKDKILIENMRPHEVNAASSGKRISFKFKSIGGNVEKSDGSGIADYEKNMVIDLVKICDKMLDRIKASEKRGHYRKSIGDVANTAKLVASEVDQLVESLLNRVDNVVKDSFGQLQDVGRAKGLDATQIAGFKNLEKFASDEIKAEERNRLKIRKKLLSLLQKIESIDE